MTGSGKRTTTLIAMSAFSLAMVLAGPLSAAPSIFAQTMASSNTGSSTSGTMENMVLNLGTPLYIEHDKVINTTNITQSISNTTFEGNGTFMDPTTGKNVSTTDSGYSISNTTTAGLARSNGQLLLKTMDGKESAFVNFADFRQVNSTMAIGIAYIQTNSTMGQQLGPLNNTLGVYKSEFISPTQGTVTFWKWK